MSRKFLYILGGSGTGKTTLAKVLPQIDPDNYHRVIQYSTRPMRPGEVNHEDYHFITNEGFDAAHLNPDGSEFFEWVVEQYAPNKYGATYDDLDFTKWNVVVACIEGLMTGITTASNSEIRVLNILGDPFASRESRNADMEERINKAVIKSFIDPADLHRMYINNEDGNNIMYAEITTQQLREMTDDECLELIESLFAEKDVL